MGSLLCSVLVAACHNHDDDVAGTISGSGGGTAAGLRFSPDPPATRAGELEDFFAVRVNGASVRIAEWELVAGPGGQLVDLGSDDEVRFVAGGPGSYTLRARADDGEEGAITFEVSSAAAQLTVSETVSGTDQDEVAARVDARNDLFIADRVGDASAPQRLARADRDGDRRAEILVPYKIDDLACDAAGNVVTLRSASAVPDDLPGALRRYDRDLVEDAGFQAPDLADGVGWQDRLTVTRAGEVVLVTTHEGGSLLYLAADGSPRGGSVQDSLVPLPVAAGDVVDVASDFEGSIYVATASEIVRLGNDGVLDTADWNPAPRDAIVAIAADDAGVVLVTCQDQDGGQCGSLRKLDWTGGQVGLLTEFTEGTFFAPRKFVRPLDLAAYGDGSWRVYDDTVSLSALEINAAWIVAADAPAIGGSAE